MSPGTNRKSEELSQSTNTGGPPPTESQDRVLQPNLVIRLTIRIRTMFKNIICTIVVLSVLSCKESGKAVDVSAFYRTQADSIHIQNIEGNLIPMYSVAGSVRKMSIPEMMKQERIPGLSIAFVDNGQIAWTKHYGYANLEDSIPITSETVFAGASLSKPVTAIAALNLVEKGLLSLDEDVNLKLKGWKVPETPLTQNEKVTLRRLIGHNAGVKNDLWSSYLPGEKVPTLNQMLAGEEPSADPATSVIHEPGSRVDCSNPGYSIIQMLLMDVSGEAFDPSDPRELFLIPRGCRILLSINPFPKT